MTHSSGNVEESLTRCEEALRFADDYAYLCGQSLDEMKDFKPIDGNPAFDRLRADLTQLLEEKAVVEVELTALKENRERAVALLEKFGFS